MKRTYPNFQRKKNVNSKKIASYSAMASAFLFVHFTAEGQIIFTDVDPDETYNINGDEYALDLNNDGLTDFTLNVIDFTVPDLFYTVVYGTLYFDGLIQDVLLVPISGNSVAGSSGSYVYPYALNSGDIINGGLPFQSNSLQTMVSYLGIIDYPSLGAVYGFYSNGNWIGVSDKYLGLKFQIGADTHYGWARLDCGADHHTFTIKDYAYNATPDASIIAGMIAEPNVEVSFSTDAVVIDESGTTVTVTLNVSDPIDAAIEVQIDAILTTATNAVDFSYIDPSPIIFSAAGPTTQSFIITIADDILPEIGEFIVFDIIAVSPGCEIATPDVITITITDDDDPIIISDVYFTNTIITYNETDGTVTGSVSLSETNDCNVDVVFEVGAGSATEGVDFTFSSPATLNFADGGATTLNFNIDVIDDLIIEADENIQFTIENATGNCMINDDDSLTINIISEDQVAINDQLNNNINIYSFNNSLFVAINISSWNKAEIFLFDTEGNNIFTDIITESQSVFNLETIPAGIYMAQIIVDGKIIAKNVYFGEN